MRSYGRRAQFSECLIEFRAPFRYASEDVDNCCDVESPFWPMIIDFFSILADNTPSVVVRRQQVSAVLVHRASHVAVVVVWLV